ncbi:hypothetical protein HDV01_000402 [Terramyces sp. JEL0728]|nr:hypothetical protein HDV01_000402 [Terramyces sp. JEL0728]
MKKGLTAPSFESISSAVFRRSIRLMYPVIVVTLVSQVLGYFGLYKYTKEASKIMDCPWLEPPKQLQSFSQFIVYVINLFTNTYYFKNLGYFPFSIIWTIPVELVGSWIMFLVAVASISLKRKLLFLGTMTFLCWFVSSWSSAFILGMVFAECANRGYFERWHSMKWAWLLRSILIVSIFSSLHLIKLWTAFYPYKFSRDLYATSGGKIGRPSSGFSEPQDERLATAISVVLFIEITPLAQKVLNTPLFDYLGKVSYGQLYPD